MLSRLPGYRANWRRGLYDSARLREMAVQRYWEDPRWADPEE